MPKKSKKFTIKESKCHCNRRWKYFRGVAGASNGMDRCTRGLQGMLTVINGMALQGCLRRQRDAPFTNCKKIEAIAEPYIKRRRAVRHLEKGRIVILDRNRKPLFYH
jgi:uridylate kinase